MEPITWSHSRLDAHSRCPRRFWHSYVAKDKPRDVEALTNGQQEHEAIRRYGKYCLQKGVAEDPNAAAGFASMIEDPGKQREFLRWAERTWFELEGIWGTTADPFELHLEAELPNGDRFQGYLDYLRVIDAAETEGLLAIYRDWKGGWCKTSAPLVPPPQLLRYAWLIAKCIPGVGEIHLQQEFIGSGTVWPGICYDEDSMWELMTHQAEALVAEIMASVSEVREALGKYEAHIERRTDYADAETVAAQLVFETRAGDQCKGCQFGNVCPAANLAEVQFYPKIEPLDESELDAYTLREVQCWHKAQADAAGRAIRQEAKKSGPVTAPDGTVGFWYDEEPDFEIVNLPGFWRTVEAAKEPPEKYFGLRSGMEKATKAKLYEDPRFRSFLRPLPAGVKWAYRKPGEDESNGAATPTREEV